MLQIGNKVLNLDDFYKVLFLGENVELTSSTLSANEKTYIFLKEFLNGKVIYGINTGLGPMAQYKVSTEKMSELQINLIKSHSCGTGEILEPLYVKAIMLSRLCSLVRGYSGIHPSALTLLKDMINLNIMPEIYEHGGVGASGDLVQLAHLALSLLGEGKVHFEGSYADAKTILSENNVKPLEIYIREGLALMNGTSAMSGISMVNLIFARNLLDWSIVASAMINEIVQSYNDHFSDQLNKLKHHKGQINIARTIRKILKGSKLIKKRADHLYNNNHDSKSNVFKEKVQEYYSVRCIPQILGPVIDTIDYAEMVITNEVNSVNDNPVIDIESNDVFHGGNFHGDYVSLEMDKLKIAITKLSMLSERQLNFLLNDKLNGILPPFLNLGTLGLNFGMQGMQFTAVSTVAENQTLSNPMYIHSIPSNNDNQDIVSMGTNSALLAKRVIENAYQAMAIELIAISQAVSYLGCENKLADYSNYIFKQIQSVVPRFEKDSPKYEDINNLKNYLLETRLNLINLTN